MAAGVKAVANGWLGSLRSTAVRLRERSATWAKEPRSTTSRALPPNAAVPRSTGLAGVETSITCSPREPAAATAIPAAQARALVSDAVEQATGFEPESVTLTSPDRVTIRAPGGLELEGRLTVTPSGDLVLVGEGPLAGRDAVLLRGGEDLPIELKEVRVTSSGGLRLAGDLAISILG